MPSYLPAAVGLLLLSLTAGATTVSAAEPEQACGHGGESARRWLVASACQDRPFDRFVREYLAKGDSWEKWLDCAAYRGAHVRSPAWAMTWEYKVFAIKMDLASEPFFNRLAEQQLNGLGAEGWEVAAMTSEKSATGRTITFVLKRNNHDGVAQASGHGPDLNVNLLHGPAHLAEFGEEPPELLRRGLRVRPEDEPRQGVAQSLSIALPADAALHP
jgi:hypothetical protein